VCPTTPPPPLRPAASYGAKYFVDDLLLPPRVYALANALVRSVDLFAYPVMGWLADNTFVTGNPFVRGRRKPFLLLTAPLAAVGLFLLYSPPPTLPTGALAAWYVLLAAGYQVRGRGGGEGTCGRRWFV
jgi:Na+/melibiose symporter-like transporter